MITRAKQHWPDEVVLDIESGRIQHIPALPFVMPPYDDSAALQGTTIVDLDNMAIRFIGASVHGGK